MGVAQRGEDCSKADLIMESPRIHWMAYFWPGLPQLWIRGSWAGLLVAVGFTALANVLLWATFVFGEWLPLETLLAGYGVLAVVWVLARWQSRSLRQVSYELAAEDDQWDAAEERPPAERDRLFREMQGHYLKNDWVAAEQLLLKLLKLDGRDVESRLMLATLWRHQQRTAEALRQLDRVSRLEAADRWQHEIAAERAALTELTEIQRSDAPSERDESISNTNNDTHDDDTSESEPRRAA